MNFGQTYQTANYRGSTQGHDAYLRSDSQQPSASASAAQSQYQGVQKQYQPVGYVQSYYKNQGGFSAASNQQAPQAFQTTQQSGLNAASQFGVSRYTATTAGTQAQWQWQAQQPFQAQAQKPSQGQSFQSFHTAQYHGSQPGHDQQLRADSTKPSSF